MNNKNNGKKKLNIEFLKDLMKTPRGRGILFFGVYFVFFLALILLIRFGNRGEVIGNELESGNPYNFSVSNITGNNYNFSYQVEIDDNIFLYQGSRYKNTELFTISNGGSIVEYYLNSENYFSNSNGLWLKADNPYKYWQFIDIKYVNNIIKNATYISKTDYESGKSVYNFQISSNTIVKLLENIDTDVDEVPNEIVVITDENNYVNEVKFLLDSYCKAKTICTNSMNINLKYGDFGNIEEIKSPLK